MYRKRAQQRGAWLPSPHYVSTRDSSHSSQNLWQPRPPGPTCPSHRGLGLGCSQHTCSHAHSLTGHSSRWETALATHLPLLAQHPQQPPHPQLGRPSTHPAPLAHGSHAAAGRTGSFPPPEPPAATAPGTRHPSAKRTRGSERAAAGPPPPVTRAVRDRHAPAQRSSPPVQRCQHSHPAAAHLSPPPKCELFSARLEAAISTVDAAPGSPPPLISCFLSSGREQPVRGAAGVAQPTQSTGGGRRGARGGGGRQSPAHTHLPCLGAKQMSDQWGAMEPHSLHQETCFPPNARPCWPSGSPPPGSLP